MAIAVWVPFVAHDYSTLREDWDLLVKEADFYGPNLRAVIAKAGGEERIKSCGRVFSGPFQVPAVAWYLHLHGNEVGIFPFGPGTTLAQGGSRLSVDPRYPEITKTRRWIVGSRQRPPMPTPSCAAAAVTSHAWPPTPRVRRGISGHGRSRAGESASLAGVGALMLLSLVLRTQRSSASASGSTRGCRWGSPTGR